MKPVQFANSRKNCPDPLAVTVTKTTVRFRITGEFAKECGIKGKELYSAFYDDASGQIGLLPDPDNKTGESRKWHGEAKGGATRHIEFPRTDLFARIWSKPAKVSGLKLNPKRKPGTILFFVPDSKGGQA